MNYIMNAAVSNAGQPGCLEFCDVADPVADSNDSLIAVAGFSLNRGEFRRAQSAQDGA